MHHRPLQFGDRFGRLRIISKLQVGYAARCDCGSVTTAIASDLINGKTKSCGCLSREHPGGPCGKDMRFIDLTGKKYGQLTVIRYVYKRQWLCECDCGNHRIAWARNLQTGGTYACSECHDIENRTRRRKRNDLIIFMFKTGMSRGLIAKKSGLSKKQVCFIVDGWRRAHDPTFKTCRVPALGRLKKRQILQAVG